MSQAHHFQDVNDRHRHRSMRSDVVLGGQLGLINVLGVILAAAAALVESVAMAGCTPRQPPRATDLGAPVAALSPAVRAQLRVRMARHGESMRELTKAVAELDHRRIAVLADAVAAEDAQLADDVPPRLRELERDFADRVRALSRAARGRDDDGVVTVDAELALACARCHATFRP